MHKAKIINNRIVYENNSSLAICLQLLNNKDVEIVVKEIKKKRSNEQNAYYWAAIVPALQYGIREQWGEVLDSEEAHSFLKNEFLKREVIDKETGEVKIIHKSTAKLTKDEFMQYINKCKDYLLNFDLIIN